MARSKKPPRRSNEVAVEFGGTKRRIHINMFGIDLAAERGYDLFDEQESIAELDTDNLRPGGQRRIMDFNLHLLWIGLLPYEPDLEFSEIQRQVSLADIPAITEAVSRANNLQVEVPDDPLAGNSQKQKPKAEQVSDLP